MLLFYNQMLTMKQIKVLKSKEVGSHKLTEIIISDISFHV